jgi:hydrogenase small subunit
MAKSVGSKNDKTHLPMEPVIPGLACTRRTVLKGALGSIALFEFGFNVSGCSSDSNSNAEFEVSGRPSSKTGIDERLPIVWLEAGVCTGCSVSMLGSTEPTIESVLPSLRLEFEETLMDRSGPIAIDRLLSTTSALTNEYLLIVDGGIPADPMAKCATLAMTSDGIELTAQELVTQLAQRALAVVAIGTCASFGGIVAAAPNPANHRPVADFVPEGKTLVRLPGCPPHATWILDALTTVLDQGLAGLELDDLGRPRSAYGGTIHDVCKRRAAYDASDFAEAPGDPSRCLFAVGCKGPSTRADCPNRLWAGRSSCIQANHPCIGCASPGFPDARTVVGAEGEIPTTPIYT